MAKIPANETTPTERVRAFQKMKRFADEQNAIPAIPPVVEPVVVEDAPTVVLPHVRDVAIVVVHREGAVCIRSHQDHRRLNNLSAEFYSGPLAHQLPIPSIFSLWTNRRTLPTGVPPDILAKRICPDFDRPKP